jgi:ATP-dependent helicase/nuclease subunit A
MNSILQQASKAQHQATVEGRSVWVSASAGTGKTYVLTNRILKLLLLQPQLKPSEILAVTYTKAAAREMENRIRERLSDWARFDDETLYKNLEMVLGTPATPAQQARAKGLLFAVLEDGKGLNISTIHGFCQQILGAFPLESDVPVGFTLLEGTQERDLIHNVQDTIFQQCEDKASSENKWFNYLVQDIHELTLRDVFKDIVYNRRKFKKLFNKFETVEDILADLAIQLELEPKQWTPESANEALKNEYYLPDEVKNCIEILNLGGKKAKDKALYIATFSNATNKQESWNIYANIFLTAKGETRKQLVDAAIKKSPQGGEAELILHQEQERVFKVENKRKSYKAWLLTASYLHLGYKMIASYKQEKYKQSALDFDDLIEKTASLLTQQESQMWVRYRMDRKIAHVMLDEAQDIDDDQWEIIKALIDEFYDGTGRTDFTRTLFAVGDTKQSIYRFRGAQPHVFGGVKKYLEYQKEVRKYDTQNISLKTSFRSSKTILNFVDMVFENEEKQTALDNTVSTKHQAVKQNSPGWVEVWPLCKEDEKEKTEPELWPLPIKQQEKRESARRILARKMAKSIQELVKNKTLLATTNKPVNYGDIMILLRGRTMMPEVIEALNIEGIPHSGADRMILTEDTMVADILAFLKFLHIHDDNLSLAHVLKSPLFNMPENTFMEVALKAKNSSLFDVLNGDNKNIIQEIIGKSKNTSVYEKIVLILTKTNAYAKYFTAFGQQDASLTTVTEPMDTFLEVALNFAKGDLAEFIYFVEMGDIDLKKGLESAGKNVRILTSHGAKGLESPVVYMPDTTQSYYSKMAMDYLLWQENNNETEMFLYRQRKEEAPALQTELQQAEKERIFEDEMRLLYVALTRSQERLYIGGAEARGKCPESCWYAEIQEITEKLSDFGDVKVLHDAPNEPIIEIENIAPADIQEVAELGWINTSPKNEGREQKPPKPNEKEDVVGEDLTKLYERGRLMHRLLEFLPLLPEGEQKQAGLDWLTKMLPTEKPDYLNDMLSGVMQVFADYPEFFEENSKAEVAYITENSFEGRIDRLVINKDKVIIIDYKTDQKIPTNMPIKYKMQLQKYVKAMRKIFPQKQIQAAILWVGASVNKIDYI